MFSIEVKEKVIVDSTKTDDPPVDSDINEDESPDQQPREIVGVEEATESTSDITHLPPSQLEDLFHTITKPSEPQVIFSRNHSFTH